MMQRQLRDQSPRFRWQPIRAAAAGTGMSSLISIQQMQRNPYAEKREVTFENPNSAIPLPPPSATGRGSRGSHLGKQRGEQPTGRPAQLTLAPLN
jgi:hypothetical protein